MIEPRNYVAGAETFFIDSLRCEYRSYRNIMLYDKGCIQHNYSVNMLRNYAI